MIFERPFTLARDSDFCGVSTTFRGPSCKWPHKRITWRQALSLPGLTPEQLQQGFAEGIAPWAEVADFEFVHQPSGPANIEAVNYRKDGIDGVLADSMLPCNFTAGMTANQRYDETDRWPYERYVKVVRHEVGHALGLSHAAQRGNIMYASLDMGVDRLGPGDVGEIVARYGRRTTPVPPPPTPGPTPEPPAFLSGDFHLDGIEGVFRLVRSGSPESAGYPPAPLRAPGEWSGPYNTVYLTDARGGQAYYYVGRKAR